MRRSDPFSLHSTCPVKLSSEDVYVKHGFGSGNDRKEALSLFAKVAAVIDVAPPVTEKKSAQQAGSFSYHSYTEGTRRGCPLLCTGSSFHQHAARIMSKSALCPNKGAKRLYKPSAP